MEQYLSHHGILGQKWGVRRFQNEDGTLTNAGKKRYSLGEKERQKEQQKANIKEKVKKYSMEADKLSAEQDKNNEYRKEVNKAYNNLGNNKAKRIINAAKGTSEEAKMYNKLSEDWINKQNALDERWHDLDIMYKETGRTYIERVINNIKYSPFR